MSIWRELRPADFGPGGSGRDRCVVFRFLSYAPRHSSRTVFDRLESYLGFKPKQAAQIIGWLCEHFFVTATPTPSGEIIYKVVRDEMDIEKAKLSVEADPVEIAAREKYEEARRLRSENAKRRWAEKRRSPGNECVAGTKAQRGQ